MMPTEVYQQRRKRLMGLIGSGLIVVPPNPESIYANDKMIRYRQNSNLIYLCGIRQKRTVLILDAAQHKTFLFIMDRDEVKEQWYGTRMDRETAGSISGVELIYFESELGIKLKDLVKNVSKIYLEQGINPEIEKLVETEVTGTDTSIVSLRERIDPLRLIKDSYEIEMIEHSMALTVDAHIEAISQTEPGMKEFELEAIYANHFRLNGGILPTYKANVAVGKNSIILHHDADASEFEAGQLVLVDCGAEYKYYTSDVARTWPVSGKFSQPQKEIYQLILRIQQDCIAMVEPGVLFWDIHHYAKRELTKGLIELGILNGELEEHLEKDTILKYFMHGIGHFLGIDAHDTPSIDRGSVVLQPGMYITIEPGLYLGDDESIPEQFRNIGIRIEDNILVTVNGCRNLSEELPKSVQEIEDLVGSNLE